MDIIKVENITFSYDNRKVINNASFKIEKGDFVCITGPNGTGKSTLLKLMLNIITPLSGKIEVFNDNNFESKISYVSQRATSFNTGFPATVREIVALGLYNNKSFLKRFQRADKKIVLNALDKVDMAEYKDRLIGELSGGQQQRVFIAKALVSNPEIIFLDEPTVGIDANMVGSICCLLGELNKKYGITILMVTHDIDSILAHANKVLNFNADGEIEVLKTDEYTEQNIHRSCSCYRIRENC